MQKLNILAVFFLIFTSNAYSFCYPDTSCESSMSSMSSDVKDVINDSFDDLIEKIDEVIEEYGKSNVELDKEIYLLEVALKGEVILYNKLSEIELYSSQSKQAKSIDISLMINIMNKIKEKKGNNNAQ